MSVEMPKPYDRPTPCESEKSYQEGWNDAVAQAQEYVDELTKERNRFRFAWNNARARAATLAEDVEFVERQATATTDEAVQR
jgi:hypothetical protein